jgi:hypothetical protein
MAGTQSAIASIAATHTANRRGRSRLVIDFISPYE